MLPPLTRDGAAQAAHGELSKRIYQQARPALLQRVISAVWRAIAHAYDRIVSATPGGALGLLVIIVALAGVAVVLARRHGVSSRDRRGGPTGLELPADRTADELRTEADALAARGEWAQAVRARLRAVVRALEERGVIDPRPGRTAAEVAAEAGSVRPELRDPLWTGALTFGEIWYGHRLAKADDDRVMRDLDTAVRRRAAANATIAVGAAPAPPPR
jgi:hypothetical protein